MPLQPPEGPEERDYVAIGRRYAEDVVAGRIVAGKWAKLACKRHLRDLARQDWTFHFDAWHANDVCDFIEKLPHVEGAWDTDTIRLEPVQIFILTTVFGWRRPGGFRRFSEVYIEAARKFAKSTLTAAVALYCLTCEGEAGPQIVVGATTGEQAGKVFLPAKRMVENTPALAEAFELETFSRSVTCRQNGGFIQPINAKGKTQDGWNPHLGILDELHAHLDRALFDVIKSAFGARKNPLLWIITTAGFDTNGVCYEQRDVAVKTLAGVVELDHLFAAIFTIDETDDPFDERVWIKANPMIGVTPTWAAMRAAAANAKVSPREEGNFKTKNLNVWMNAVAAWLSGPQWKACADPTLTWDDFKGRDCWVGLDLSDKDDITAAVLAAFDDDDRLIFKPLFWLPEAVLNQAEHRAGRGSARYRDWAKQNFIRLTPGDWIDHAEVEKTIRQWAKDYSLRRVTFDQFAAGQLMASRLNEDLASSDNPLAMILPKNAKNVTDPAKDLEARVKSGISRLRHDDNPVMNWMAGNVCVDHRRDGTILPTKEKAMSLNKIDGIDALINALHPMVIGIEPAGRSIYDDEAAYAEAFGNPPPAPPDQPPEEEDD